MNHAFYCLHINIFNINKYMRKNAGSVLLETESSINTIDVVLRKKVTVKHIMRYCDKTTGN